MSNIGANRGVCKRLHITDDTEVLIMTVEVADDVIAGQHFRQIGFHILKSKAFKARDEELVIVLRVGFLVVLDDMQRLESAPHLRPAYSDTRRCASLLDEGIGNIIRVRQKTLVQMRGDDLVVDLLVHESGSALHEHTHAV